MRLILFCMMTTFGIVFIFSSGLSAQEEELGIFIDDLKNIKIKAEAGDVIMQFQLGLLFQTGKSAQCQDLCASF